MKKVLFIAAVFALGMTALVSCSSKEGADVANDESVEGATDGMDLIEESVTEIAPEDGMPGNIIDNASDIDVSEMGDQAINQAMDAAEKNMDKAKEIAEKSMDKAKEITEKSMEKAKELSEKSMEQAKDLLNNLK